MDNHKKTFKFLTENLYFQYMSVENNHVHYFFVNSKDSFTERGIISIPLSYKRSMSWRFTTTSANKYSRSLDVTKTPSWFYLLFKNAESIVSKRDRLRKITNSYLKK